jgi:hypothetical protein
MVPTGLLAHFFEWALRRVMGRTEPRVVTANVISLVVATVAAGFGYADGGPPQFYHGFIQNLLPQVIWLIIMLIAKHPRKVA